MWFEWETGRITPVLRDPFDNDTIAWMPEGRLMIAVIISFAMVLSLRRSFWHSGQFCSEGTADD